VVGWSVSPGTEEKEEKNAVEAATTHRRPEVLMLAWYPDDRMPEARRFTRFTIVKSALQLK
jgi:hypothetical protein